MSQIIQCNDAAAIAGAVSNPARLAAMNAYGILEPAQGPDFDEVVRLASDLCVTPMALISFMTAERQWFEARVGFTLWETPLSQSVCVHGLLQPGLLVIPDLAADPRTREMVPAMPDPPLRFYAGAQLETPDGIVLGMLAVVDTAPRPDGLTQAQSRGLRALARQAMRLLEARRAIRERDQAVSELAQSEAVLAEAASLARLGIFEWDIATDVMLVNARLREMFGFAAGETLTGEKLATRIDAADQERLRAEFTERHARREPFDCSYRIELADGGRRRINSLSRPRFDRDGSVTHYVGALRDETDERDAAAALMESEARLEAVFEAVPVGIVLADAPSGRIVTGNAQAERIFGHPIIRSLDVDSYKEWVSFHEDGRQVAGTEYPLARVLAGEDRPELEVLYRRGDGATRWVRLIASPILAGDGSLSGAVVASLDIDREKRGEAALRELNQVLEQRVAERTAERDQLWTMSNLLLLVAELDTTIMAVGPGWENMLGWPEAELVGRRYSAFIHPDDLERSLEWGRRITAGEKLGELDNRYRCKNGQYRAIAWTITDGDGLLRCVGRDVTVERHQANELARAEEQLRQAQKMEAVGQLTGGIAHDFNNLLTGISASLELLNLRMAQGRLDDLERYIGTAQESARRAAALTHRLLAFSRRQTLAPRPTDVQALVESMEELIRRSVGPAIAVELICADELWPSLIDPSQLEAAVLNLCINARDAMPEGGRITIGVENRRLGTSAAEALGVVPGRYIALSVADTGEGMSAEVVGKAFEPFFTTKPIGMGTGLGLSMIYGFAKQSGGTVAIESVVGAGTTVRVYLPRHVGRVEQERQAAQLGAAPLADAGETVLMVDDEPTIRLFMGEVLEGQGYAVLEAGDGPGGLLVLQSPVRIDLLLTDVGLPGGLNGRQLADAARAMRPGLKVLFITGYAETAVLGGCDLDLGMHVLTKPFTLEALLTRVRTILAG